MLKEHTAWKGENMPKKKKDIKQKFSEYTYARPTMDKRFLELKKHLGEVSSMLNDKKKNS